MIRRYDFIVVGAGPAGLCGAIEAAKRGLRVVVFDENLKPGGQLFKQIHKFFGSKEHKAKMRGFQIGLELLKEADAAGVQVVQGAVVVGLYLDKEVVVRTGDTVTHYKADAILVATGAAENMVSFEGWTLPGVIGAGAAQTMMNLHHVRPGSRVLMLGTGNVGLVVSFQLLQAGCQVVALADAAPRIGGYGVHAAKVARCGVPFYLSHTIVRAEGDDCVTGVVIGAVDSGFQFIPGSEKHFEVDTICIAVGLSPMSQLLSMAGCAMEENPKKGGSVPVCGPHGETSVGGIFAAGDVSGIEEASSAMIKGRISGIAAARWLGYIGAEEMESAVSGLRRSLSALHRGMFSPENKGKLLEKTEEGCDISKTLLYKGYLTEEEALRYPGVTRRKGVHPVIECTQNIPCNPCQDACPAGCIKIGSEITSLPAVEESVSCIGCGMCVSSCSGQAIFLIDEEYDAEHAAITIPYEFLPLAQPGDQGTALDRSGKPVCEARVVGVKTAPAFDRTSLLTFTVPKAMAYSARFFVGKGVR